jgi:hypothetical protein
VNAEVIIGQNYPFPNYYLFMSYENFPISRDGNILPTTFAVETAPINNPKVNHKLSYYEARRFITVTRGNTAETVSITPTTLQNRRQ